jgi:hypothetical protein
MPLTTTEEQLQSRIDLLEAQVEQLLGSKRQLDQLLSHTILLGGTTGANSFWSHALCHHPDRFSLYEDWDRYLKGDIRCDEDFYVNPTEIADDDVAPSRVASAPFVSPPQSPEYDSAPLKRTMTCPPAPRKLQRVEEMVGKEDASAVDVVTLALTTEVTAE